MEYAAFERVFGPLTVQERVDAAGALSAWGSIVSMGGGDRYSPVDFIPKWGLQAAPEEQDDEQMIATMRRIQSKTKKGEDGND